MAQHDDAVASILGDWQARRERGDLVPPEQVIAEHPDLAEALRERFSALGALEQAATRVQEPLRLRPLPPDRYRGFRKLGQGGMGIVYWALDGDLNRQVAFKMVRPDVGGEGAAATDAAPLSMAPPAADTPASQAFQTLKKRFLQEAWVTGGMEHPGIVPVYEVGETPEGVPYYTMRFVKGERTLAQAIEAVDGKPIEERLALLEPLLKVCDAVRYAHARGVVHRDLKPENVALGAFGEVVVLDWGLAKVRGAADAEVDAWTRRIETYRSAADLKTVAGLLGTPGTMSPEAARGGSSDVDQRSDVYSLGAILFRILTGRLPHRLTTFGEFLRDLLGREAPLATELAPDVPPGLARLCAQALARDRDARTRSVEAFAEGLRDWQRHRAAEAEVAALLQRATAEADAAAEARGRLRGRPLDRATSAVEQALARHPGHPEARQLRARIGALREESSRQQSLDWRRRVGLRLALLALILGGGALFWARQAATRTDEGLALELARAQERVLRYRGPALAAQALTRAAEARAQEAREDAARAWADLVATGARSADPDPGRRALAAAWPGGVALWGRSPSTHERDRGRAALEAAWPLWAPRLLPPPTGLLPEAVRSSLLDRERQVQTNVVAGLGWVQGDLLLLLAGGGLWRVPDGDAHGPARLVGEPKEQAFDGECGLAVAPDGRWAVAVTSDRRALCVWELQGSTPPRVLARESGWALPWADAAGARRLLVSDFLSLRVLDPVDGRELERLHWPGERVSTPHGGAIVGTQAFVALDDRVVVLDLGSGAVVRTLEQGARHLAAVADGAWIAGWGSQRTRPGGLTLWDPVTGDALHHLSILTPETRQGVAFSPQGDVVAITLDYPALALHEVATGRRLTVLLEGLPRTSPIAFRPDGARLCLGGLPTLLWDTQAAPDVQVLARFPGGPVAPEGGDPAVAVSGETVAWLERHAGRVLLRQRAPGSLRCGPAFEVARGAVALALSPTGARAVVGTHEPEATGSTGRVLLYDLGSGRELAAAPPAPGGVRALSVTRDGEHVWLAREDREPPECLRLPTLEPRPHEQRTFPSHREGFGDAQTFLVRRLEALPEGTGVVVEWASRPSLPDAPARYAPRRWMQVFSRSRGWSLDRAPRFPTEILGWAPDPAGGVRWLGEDRLLTEGDRPAAGTEGLRDRGAQLPPHSLRADAAQLRAQQTLEGPAAFTGLAVSDDGLLDVIPHLRPAPLELPTWTGLSPGPHGAPHHALRVWLGHPTPLRWVAFVPGTHVLVSACSEQLLLHDLTWLILTPEDRLERLGEER